MTSTTMLARNTEYTFLRNVSQTKHGGALMPDVSSWTKPPTQLFQLTCISRKSVFEIDHAMLLFPNFIVTITFVSHAGERVRRWASQDEVATHDTCSSPCCRR